MHNRQFMLCRLRVVKQVRCNWKPEAAKYRFHWCTVCVDARLLWTSTSQHICYRKFALLACDFLVTAMQLLLLLRTSAETWAFTLHGSYKTVESPTICINQSQYRFSYPSFMGRSVHLDCNGSQKASNSLVTTADVRCRGRQPRSFVTRATEHRRKTCSI